MTKACEFCGEPFKADRRARRFCSQSCHAQTRIEQLREMGRKGAAKGVPTRQRAYAARLRTRLLAVMDKHGLTPSVLLLRAMGDVWKVAYDRGWVASYNRQLRRDGARRIA